MEVFWAVMAGITAFFAAALVLYIAGRILLPDMGLRAPDYWAWFWATFFVGGFAGIVKAVLSI